MSPLLNAIRGSTRTPILFSLIAVVLIGFTYSQLSAPLSRNTWRDDKTASPLARKLAEVYNSTLGVWNALLKVALFPQEANIVPLVRESPCHLPS